MDPTSDVCNDEKADFQLLSSYFSLKPESAITDRVEACPPVEERGTSPARHPGAVNHLSPLLLIGGHFHVITVGAFIAVPQQQPEQRRNQTITCDAIELQVPGGNKPNNPFPKQLEPEINKTTNDDISV